VQLQRLDTVRLRSERHPYKKKRDNQNNPSKGNVACLVWPERVMTAKKVCMSASCSFTPEVMNRFNLLGLLAVDYAECE
jgi:hypothetical protein